MKLSNGQKIGYLILVLIVVSSIWYALYRTAIIFPPVTPINLEELADWDEFDIKRILSHYNCNKVSFYSPDLPQGLKELGKFCHTVNGYWADAYNESQYGSAYKGAKRLRETRSNE